MLFSELIKRSGVQCLEMMSNAEIDSVEFDSRKAGAGWCFVAVRGSNCDGHDFIASAVTNGCAAVVCEDASNIPVGLPYAQVADSRLALGLLAQGLHHWPCRKLCCVGITGTNGKSTVAMLIQHILQKAGYEPALLGTISYQTGKRSMEASTTTPQPVALAQMCDEMVQAGMTHLVMETSSHALDQDRVAGFEFKVGVFTNLTGDHLDYHKTMENYLWAKRKLFAGLGEKAFAVTNLDDPHGQSVVEDTKAKVIGYSLKDKNASLFGTVKKMDQSGMVLEIVFDGKQAAIQSRLIGTHNAQNLCAAAGAGAAMGIDVQTVGEALGEVSNIPGRLQRVEFDADYTVFVDYAHTDDALANVLNSLRPVTKGRLVAVFGCGGDRDRTKRPRMGKIAASLADSVLVTSDNPRSEDPHVIINEILSGISAGADCKVEPDRKKAIEQAIANAKSGDVILLAGKGHETYQEIKGVRTEFNDAAVATEAMRNRDGIKTIGR